MIEPFAEDLVPDADGLVRRSWAIGGAALSALEVGTPDARPDGGPLPNQTIVLLHGIPTSAELWRDVMPRLAAEGHHVVAFDLPGYGHTLLPAGADHSLAGAAELIATWVRLNVGGGVWLVGHDLGGAAAQILVSRHPTLLGRLTLINSVHADSWPVRPIRMLQWVARANLYPAMATLGLVPNPWTRRELAGAFADPSRLTDEVLERVFWDDKVTEDTGRRAFARHLRALDPFQTTMAAGSLPRVPVPTQLIWGARDQYQPFEEVGAELAEVLPTPDVTLVEDAGHFAPLEAPEQVARALLDWQPDDTGR